MWGSHRDKFASAFVPVRLRNPEPWDLLGGEEPYIKLKNGLEPLFQFSVCQAWYASSGCELSRRSLLYTNNTGAWIPVMELRLLYFNSPDHSLR